MQDINYILEVMPHRYPFLMVDRIIEHQKKESIKTLARFLGQSLF